MVVVGVPGTNRSAVDGVFQDDDGGLAVPVDGDSFAMFGVRNYSWDRPFKEHDAIPKALSTKAWMSGRSAQQVLARRADLVDLRYTDVALVSVVSAPGPLSDLSSSGALVALGIGQ